MTTVPTPEATGPLTEGQAALVTIDVLIALDLEAAEQIARGHDRHTIDLALMISRESKAREASLRALLEQEHVALAESPTSAAMSAHILTALDALRARRSFDLDLAYANLQVNEHLCLQQLVDRTLVPSARSAPLVDYFTVLRDSAETTAEMAMSLATQLAARPAVIHPKTGAMLVDWKIPPIEIE